MYKKDISRLAIPAILASIVEPLLSIADSVIVGNIPENSTQALAAIGIAGSFVSTIIWGVSQFRSAITATVSKYLGMNRLSEIQGLIPQTLLLNILTGLLIFYGTVAFSNEIFNLYNPEEKILLAINSYYEIRAMSYPLMLTIFIFFGVFRGLQNTSWSMYIALIGAILNVGLNYLFVYGWTDNPDYIFACRQVAIASLISQLVMLGMAIWFYLKKTPFDFYVLNKIHSEFKNVVKMATNLLIRTIALNFVIHFSNFLATQRGSSQMAAQSILTNMWLFSSFFMDGVSSAANIMSGKLLGEKNYIGLRKMLYQVLKIGVLTSFLLVLLFSVFYSKIGEIFTNAPLVLEKFHSLFWYVILIQPIGAITYTFDALYKGLGRARELRNILLMTSFGIFTVVLTVLYFIFDLGMDAIWISFSVWLASRGVFVWISFEKKNKTT